MDTIVNCQYCGTTTTNDLLDEHETTCPKHLRCKKCGKSYKRKKAFQKHTSECKQKPNSNRVLNRKKKRPSINSNLRMDVWKKYVGKHLKTKCFCCCKNEITPFSGVNTFHAGHIISHNNGGGDIIENLLPICRSCNMNMYDENWPDYVNRHQYMDYSKNISLAYYSRYEKGIKLLQSLYRNHLWTHRRNWYIKNVLSKRINHKIL